MTFKTLHEAAGGNFMARSCNDSKFALVNGSQLDEFQEDHTILQIDTKNTYTNEVTGRWLFGRHYYNVYMVEYVNKEPKTVQEELEETPEEGEATDAES